MKANIGRPDRLIRICVGFALLLAPLLNVPAIWSSQTIALISIVVGLILIGTGLFGFCPAYRLLGIGTLRS